MDFTFGGEQEAFRSEVRVFLEETLIEECRVQQRADGRPGWSPAFSRGGWSPEYLAAIPGTIAQGSSEVQRNVAGPRGSEERGPRG